MGFKKVVAITIIITTVVAVLMVTVPGIPPYIEPKAFVIQPPRRVEGWFATNTILDEAELIYEQVGSGVESIAIQDDEVITGTQTGALIKITAKNMVTNITTLKFPCGSDVMLPFGSGKKTGSCGYPLGMRFDEKGFLFVLDYFGGLTKVNIKTGEYKNLVPKRASINNKFPHVPEDLDITKDGTIYWSDGSTTGNFYVEMIGGPSGRLIKYHPETRKNEVLLENLYFSNGVCLSDDEKFVLVAESGNSRIVRYHLSGEKKGQSDTFVDSLPGYPDNIRSNGRGGFYVALILPWDDHFSMQLHLLAPRPILRKLILRSRHLLLSALEYMKILLPENIYLNFIQKYIIEVEPVLQISKGPKTAKIVELSNTGEILGILNGKSGKISSLSQITVGKNFAFLVSPMEGKIWRIKLNVLRRMQ